MSLFPQRPFTRIDGNDIFLDERKIGKISPTESATRQLCDERPSLRLLSGAPRLTVHLGSTPVARYRIDPIAADPNLAGKFFHASIRILDNLALMMDGLVSTDEHEPTAGAAVEANGHRFSEGIRFQPVFVGAAQSKNALMAGKGLFERGLHFSGTITPGTVRVCGLCDRCGEGFNVEHVHTGFSSGQYLYCAKGTHTALVDLERRPGCPHPLQKTIDPVAVAEFEAGLPPCARCGTSFRFLHPLRCPHCAAPWLDFERFPAMRPTEYYGCILVGENAQRL